MGGGPGGAALFDLRAGRHADRDAGPQGNLGHDHGPLHDRAGRQLHRVGGALSEQGDVDLVHYYPVRVSPDAERLDTLPHVEFVLQLADLPSVGLRRPAQFGPRLKRALGCRDDIWFASSGEYRVYRRSLAGDTAVVFTLGGVRPAPVDEADRDELRATFERYGAPALLRDYLQALPENKPVIVGLFVDGAGHVFVAPETSRVDAGTVIDVFRDDGVFLGRVAVPEAVRIDADKAYATGDYMLFAGEDEVGTPYVTRLRIGR